MKKLIILVLGVFLLSACGYSQEGEKNGNIAPVPLSGGLPLYEVKVDSCEYLVIRGTQSGNVLTHKGNCKYCAKIRQREHRELIEAIRSLRSVEAKRK